MIQFACPTCKSTCSVDDKFAGRKAKCPKCGARVRHLKGSEVELLSAGTPPPPVPASVSAATTVAAPAAEPSPAPAPAGSADATPLASAALPHAVGDFVRQSESKQNTLVIGGLIGVFAIALSATGMLLNIPLLVVTPLGIAMTIAAAWLFVRKKKLQSKLKPETPPALPPKK